MRLVRWAVIVLWGAVFWAGLGFSGVEETKKSLQQVQAELKQKKKEKDQNAKRAKELKKQIEKITRDFEMARRSLASVNQRLTVAEEKRTEAEARLRESQHTLTRWEERLGEALSAYYQRGSVVTEGSYASLVYEESLLADRVAGLSFAKENHRNVQSFRNDLLKAESDLRFLRKEKEREEVRLEKSREPLKRMEQTAEGRQAILETQIKELNASAEKFEKMIRKLIIKSQQVKSTKSPRPVAPGGKRVISPPPPSQRLPWPVRGTVVETFGRRRHPVLDTYVISNGITVRSSEAALVSCVAPGEVLYAGPFMNYGLTVLISHSRGLHSVYAHLGGLQVTRGQSVVEGTPVGTAGKDLDDHPTVYFELRQDGQPVDPQSWLRPEQR